MLGVGALALSALTVTALPSTLASWNDSSTVTSGSFTAGKIDLTVGGQQGKPDPYPVTSLTLTAMAPGESVAAAVAIGNAGDVPFTWVPTVTTSGALGPALTVDLKLNGTVDNSPGYPRKGTCAGGTALTSGSSATRLNPGATAQPLCVVVSLPAGTGNGFQSATGTVTIGFVATQVLP